MPVSRFVVVAFNVEAKDRWGLAEFGEEFTRLGSAHSGISTQKLNHSFLSDSFLEIDNMVSAAGKEKNSPTFPLRTSKKLSWKLAKRQFCVVILANLFT